MAEKPVWNYNPKTAGKTTMVLGTEKTDYRKKDEINKERTPTALTKSRKKQVWFNLSISLLFRLKIKYLWLLSLANGCCEVIKFDFFVGLEAQRGEIWNLRWYKLHYLSSIETKYLTKKSW